MAKLSKTFTRTLELVPETLEVAHTLVKDGGRVVTAGSNALVEFVEGSSVSTRNIVQASNAYTEELLVSAQLSLESSKLNATAEIEVIRELQDDTEYKAEMKTLIRQRLVSEMLEDYDLPAQPATQP